MTETTIHGTTPAHDGDSPGVRLPAGERGDVVITVDRCKGCELCVEHCPPEVLSISEELNRGGYHPAHYAGSGCTGCTICFYVCPEPGAIAVFRRERGDE